MTRTTKKRTLKTMNTKATGMTKMTPKTCPSIGTSRHVPPRWSLKAFSSSVKCPLNLHLLKSPRLRLQLRLFPTSPQMFDPAMTTHPLPCILPQLLPRPCLMHKLPVASTRIGRNNRWLSQKLPQNDRKGPGIGRESKTRSPGQIHKAAGGHERTAWVRVKCGITLIRVLVGKVVLVLVAQRRTKGMACLLTSKPNLLRQLRHKPRRRHPLQLLHQYSLWHLMRSRAACHLYPLLRMPTC